MRKLDFPNLIAQSVDELREREKKENNARLRLRVQMLRLLKSGEIISIKAASQTVGISPKHGYDLWHLYREKGLDKLLELNWKPRLSKLSAEQQSVLLLRASQENGFGSQAEAIKYVADEFGVSYTQGGVCLLFQRLKIKAKEPRPENKRADKNKQSEYKKTLSAD